MTECRDCGAELQPEPKQAGDVFRGKTKAGLPMLLVARPHRIRGPDGQMVCAKGGRGRKKVKAPKRGKLPDDPLVDYLMDNFKGMTREKARGYVAQVDSVVDETRRLLALFTLIDAEKGG